MLAVAHDDMIADSGPIALLSSGLFCSVRQVLAKSTLYIFLVGAIQPTTKVMFYWYRCEIDLQCHVVQPSCHASVTVHSAPGPLCALSTVVLSGTTGVHQHVSPDTGLQVLARRGCLESATHARGAPG